MGDSTDCPHVFPIEPSATAVERLDMIHHRCRCLALVPMERMIVKDTNGGRL
jgi:hypothetical protein